MNDELEQIVQRMLDAGESEEDIAAVIQAYEPSAPAPERTWTDTAVDALPMIGGAVGGVAGALGGPLGAIGGAALGGAGGEGFRQAANALRGKGALLTPGQAASGMAGQAALQGGAQAAGGAVGKGLQLAGRGMYRAGVLPIMQVFSKHGDVIGKGLEAGVLPTKGGLAKAGAMKAAAMDRKLGLLDAAGQKGSIWLKGVTDDALTKSTQYAHELKRAGFQDPMPGMVKRADRILKANPKGVAPGALEAIKHTTDNTLGPAFKKIRMKEALSPDERMGVDLTGSMGSALEQIAPGYKAANKEIMDAAGLEKMIARRVGPAANQGLENAMTIAGGIGALPARLMMIPPVMSGAGLAAHRASKIAPPATSNALRAAMLAALREPER